MLISSTLHAGKNEEAYIMDAKVIGNLGRYMNHSCRPNVFVQNVFVSISSGSMYALLANKFLHWVVLEYAGVEILNK